MVWGVIHLPGGQQIITCSWDGSLRVWDLGSGKQIGEDWRDGESKVFKIELSPDGKTLVSGSGDGAVRLWDIDTCNVIAKWMGHAGRVRALCWSRDGRRVVSGSDDGTARQWDVESGETIYAPIKAGHKYMEAVVYSPDTTLIATAVTEIDNQIESLVEIWDAKTSEQVATPSLKRDISSLAWTADGKTLISGSINRITTWNTKTWEQIAVLDVTSDSNFNFISAIAISPNDCILASSSSNGTVQLWNLDAGQCQPIGSPLHHANLASVRCVSFSADGKLLATGCDDSNAYTWDVATIVREAVLDDLLSQTTNKSGFHVQRRLDAHRVPRGFFDDPPDHSRSSTSRHPTGLSSASHGNTILGHLAYLFRPTHSDADITSPSSPLDWGRNLLTRHKQSREGIELHDRRATVVEVPYAQGKRRNASAREKRRPVPLHSKNAATGNSRPPKTNVTQQSVGAAGAQLSLQLHAAIATSSATPPVVATSEATASTTSHPHAYITLRHAGRWTRFWLFICCTSPEYTSGHH